MIKALAHIAIQVTDLEKALGFYCGILELKEVFRLKDDSGRVFLVYLKLAERQFLELFPAAKESHQNNLCAGPIHLCLEVDDIQNAYQTIRDKGWKMKTEAPILGMDQTWQFWVDDPDGNPIEFHQYSPQSMQFEE